MNFNKLTLFLAGLIIFSLLFKNVVKATVDKPVTVNISTEFVELRSEPSFESKIVTKVRNGTIAFLK
jgi:hypothetical protein